MKSLNAILNNVPILNTDIDISNIMVRGIAIDSRLVLPDYLFIAVKGTNTDGHHFIDAAIEKGASVIIHSESLKENNKNVQYILVADTQVITGIIASNFYDNPSALLRVTGVTGTNGKTSIATLLYRLFTKLGYKCGLISTVENIIGDEKLESSHTTPDSISLQALLRNMADHNCTHVFMEVSSHAVDQGRINGINWAGGIFTNITHDHLDYHKTFDAYIKAKKKFFDILPPQAFALTNIDDKRGMVMLQNTKATKKTYGIQNAADYKGKIMENNLHGLYMQINGQDIYCLLTGVFNAYNLLAVYGAAIELGIDKTEVLQIISELRSAAGRFETYRSLNEEIIGIVDYAHTPDALINVLATIKNFDIAGKVITVVGCGGDRDKTKRPSMTIVSAEHSDQVIITSDNPRSEDPETILDNMTEGISAAYSRKILRIVDRRQAIKAAVAMAQKGDVILIAGKGHEKYQEIQGVKNHFDDVEELLIFFKMLEK